MKTSLLKKIVVVVCVAILLFAGYLFYSRPTTIEQRYPMLTLDKCILIYGNYYDGRGTALSEFSFAEDSEEYTKLCALFFEQEYRRSIRDIFPRGPRTHQPKPGDYEWKVSFLFKDIELPDGSVSDVTLHFQNWYGELDIYVDREKYACNVREQEIWAKEVLDLIQ